MINYSRTLFVLLFTIIAGVITAQNGVNSPYTRYGFGLLSDQSTTANRGMGGISYGLRNKLINVGNPASYSAVDSITFLFDAGISLQNANFNSGDVKMNAKNSSLDYIAMQFRLYKKIGATIGLVPFSKINYSFSGDGQKVPGNDESSDVYSYESFNGSGGLHQVFAGIGVGAVTGNWYVALAGVAALILTQGRSKKNIFAKLFSGIASLYDITSYFGDILSYSRLMTLLLAGGVIATIVNMLGSMSGNIFAFTIIFLIGHAFNMGLNIIGTYVHSARLQYLEFFGKFYKEGGKPFTPLKIKTNFVSLKEEK